MLKILSFNLLIISFVLISCSKSSDSSTSTASTVTYATSKSGATASGSMTIGSETLSGTYATLCADASSTSSKPTDTTYVGFVLVVTGSSSFTRELNYYTDSACTTLSLGWYFNNDNATIGDASGSDYKVTWNQVNQTFFANTTAGKTYIDDLFGGGMDVPVGSAFVGTTGVTYYNLIKISGTSIYLGNPSGTEYPSTTTGAEYVKQ